jgi:HD superfamily phosphodiesterase
MDKEQALEWVRDKLGDSPRAAHSALVGRIMAQLAPRFGADAALWEVVGLCHDLDLPQTESDLSQHGPLAAQWLAGLLPPGAAQAIAAHDHHAGLEPVTALAQSLRAADALANASRRVSVAEFAQFAIEGGKAYAALAARLGEGRRHLAEMLRVYEEQTGVTLAELTQILDMIIQPHLPGSWSA